MGVYYSIAATSASLPFSHENLRKLPRQKPSDE